MIPVTRLNGSVFAVNPDLVVRADTTPDTVLTLVDGSKYVVLETLDEFVALVVAHRARVVRAAAAAGTEPAGDAADHVADGAASGAGHALDLAGLTPATPADRPRGASTVVPLRPRRA